MKTRTQTKTEEQERPYLYDEPTSMDLETLSDEELELLLFEEEPKKQSGLLNLPTVAGLSLILVGVVYILQELGLYQGFGFDVSTLAAMLPWLAATLIILLGFGVLSWRPGRKKKRVKRGVEAASGKEKIVLEKKSKKDRGKRKLQRSPDKKIAGVCAGIGDYFKVDPTLIRIAFVLGTIFSGGPPFLIAYILLAFIMPKPEEKDPQKGELSSSFSDLGGKEERVVVIRDT